jgi:hypothetical protein
LSTFCGYLAMVLEGTPETRAALAVGDEDHPVSGRI